MNDYEQRKTLRPLMEGVLIRESVVRRSLSIKSLVVSVNSNKLIPGFHARFL